MIKYLDSIVIILVVVLITITGCISKEEIEKDRKIENIPILENNISDNKSPELSDKYIFIDRNIYISGELIEGNYTGPLIDFPTYSFDKDTGTLKGIVNFDINDSLKIIYGNGTSLGGAVGGGMATTLSGIYKLPYMNGIKILKVDQDGTVYLEHNNISIILKGGEEWINVTSKIDVLQIGDRIGKANITTTDKIVNYGILDKSKILIWNESNDRYRRWKE